MSDSHVWRGSSDPSRISSVGGKTQTPLILSNLLFFCWVGGGIDGPGRVTLNGVMGGASTLYYHFAYFYTLAELYTLYDYLL